VRRGAGAERGGDTVRPMLRMVGWLLLALLVALAAFWWIVR
jgi:hypothetical protein